MSRNRERIDMFCLAVLPDSARRAYDRVCRIFSGETGLLSCGLNTLCVKKRDNHVVIEFGVTDFTQPHLRKYKLLQRDTKQVL